MIGLTVKVEGDMVAIMAAELGDAAHAVTRGIGKASEGLKAELRQQVTGAGMSQRMANTWRAEVYPDRAGTTSLRAAGLVFSRAPDIVDAFNKGVPIRSPRGFYLAIPTPAAGGKGVARDSTKRERLTPGGWERRTGLRLRHVFRKGKKTSYLVADGVRIGAGGVARSNVVTRKGNRATRITGSTTAVIFWLVPLVRLGKRFDVAGAAQRWSSRLPDLIVQSWPEGRR